MKELNKIICITISIICFSSISCRLSSIIDYDNQEEEQFIDTVLENQEQYIIDNALVFVYLRNTWENYVIVFSIYYQGSMEDIPSLKVSKMNITDEQGNTIFSCVNQDISSDEIFKAEEQYHGKYSRYGKLATETIPLESLTADKYYVNLEINGKNIQETLVMLKRTYLVMR